jgi:DNA polymerase III epsilon subunit-like protein
MIAHNMPFDRNMLLFELRRLGVEYNFPWPFYHLCTAEISKSFFKGKYTKLEKVYHHAYGHDPEQKHRAVGDCEILLDVARWLNKQGAL